MRFPRISKTGSHIRRSVSYPPGSDGLGSGSGSRPHGAAPLCTVHDPRLAHPGAATLNKDYKYDYEKQAGNYPDDRGAVHFDSPFPRQFDKNCWNCSIIVITAGPRTTRNSAGKMKNTSGNTSFTEVFAAISSTC